MRSFLIAALSFFSCCCASQPFEQLFLTGGVAPVVYHARHPSVTVLQSADHFIRFVSEAGANTLVCFDTKDATTLDMAVAIAQHLEAPLSVVLVDTQTHSFLVRALARTIGVTEVPTPSVLVCVQGKAVLPLVVSLEDKDEARRAIAERFAQTAPREVEPESGILARWWTEGAAQMHRIWDKISGYLFV